MRRMCNFPRICAYASPYDLGTKKDEALRVKQVPEEWVARFEEAEAALRNMADTVLSDHINTSVIKDRFEGVCNPDDFTLETFFEGNASVIDMLCSHVHNAQVALDVMKALREGELNHLLQV